MQIDYDLLNKYLALLKYSVTGKNPPENITAQQAETFYNYGDTHGVRLATAVALNNLNVPLDKIRTQLVKDFKNETYLDVIQHEYFDMLSEKCLEPNVKFIPLKGLYFKNMYPSGSMREMNDLDILIHPNDREKMKKVMDSLGLKCTQYDENSHDIYTSKFIIIEVHSRFIPENFADRCKVDEDVWERAVPREKFPCIYDLCAEDLYAFHIAHAYKHYLYGGFGIRILLDTFVLLQKYPGLRSAYTVQEKLQSQNLKNFMPVLELLSDIWFSKSHLTLSDYPEMSKYIFFSGTYGNDKNKAVNEYAVGVNPTSNTFRMYFHLLFPPMKIMKVNYKYLEQKPALLPAAYAHRIAARCLMNSEKRKIYYDYTQNPFAYQKDEKRLQEYAFTRLAEY